MERDKAIFFIFVSNIEDNESTGKKPPDEITDKARFSDMKDLKLNISKYKKRIRVRIVYNKKILIDCLIISDVLKDK